MKALITSTTKIVDMGHIFASQEFWYTEEEKANAPSHDKEIRKAEAINCAITWPRHLVEYFKPAYSFVGGTEELNNRQIVDVAIEECTKALEQYSGEDIVCIVALTEFEHSDIETERCLTAINELRNFCTSNNIRLFYTFIGWYIVDFFYDYPDDHIVDEVLEDDRNFDMPIKDWVIRRTNNVEMICPFHPTTKGHILYTYEGLLPMLEEYGIIRT